MHGMGDAATNTGMASMRNAISERLGGTYVVNVAMGASAAADARNSIFLSMDLEVEAFAMQVRKDYRLAHGFNAIGYSLNICFDSSIRPRKESCVACAIGCNKSC